MSGPAQAPATGPAPESPAGLSRSARNLKQLPISFAEGGLAALQQVQQGIIDALRTIQPALAPTLAAINSTLDATVNELLLPEVCSLCALAFPSFAVTLPHRLFLPHQLVNPRRTSAVRGSYASG